MSEDKHIQVDPLVGLTDLEYVAVEEITKLKSSLGTDSENMTEREKKILMRLSYLEDKITQLLTKKFNIDASDLLKNGLSISVRSGHFVTLTSRK